MQEEVRMELRATERERGRERRRRWVIQWMCINRRRVGKAAAHEPTQACWDPAASPLDLVGSRVKTFLQILWPHAVWFRPPTARPQLSEKAHLTEISGFSFLTNLRFFFFQLAVVQVWIWEMQPLTICAKNPESKWADFLDHQQTGKYVANIHF